MRNTTLYLWAKKIHRFLVLLITFFGISMMATGYMMREGIYFSFDSFAVRALHNNISIAFSIMLGIMILTGVYLFLFPYLPTQKETKPM